MRRRRCARWRSCAAIAPRRRRRRGRATPSRSRGGSCARSKPRRAIRAAPPVAQATLGRGRDGCSIRGGRAGRGVAHKRWSPGKVSGSVAGAGAARRSSSAGTANDVSASRHVATFEGRVHCFSMLPGGRTLAGRRRRSAARVRRRHRDRRQVASPLRPETYLYGCPVLSSDGRELLYESVDEPALTRSSTPHSPDGEGGRVLTKGMNPEWIPDTDDFVFDLDLTHAAVFSIPVMNSSVVPDDSNGQRRLAGKAVSFRGNLLALRYLDARGQNLFAIHSLPDLETRATFSLARSRATSASTGAPMTSRFRSKDRRGTRCSPRSTGAHPWRAIALR